MNASNSSSEWKCSICPETTCSTRPSQASGAPGGWARNCTTKARLVGSGRGSWGIDDLRQRPVQAGHFRIVRGLPRRYNTLSVSDQSPSVQIGGCGARGAFQNCASCSGGRHDGTRAPEHLWALPAGGDAGALVAGRRGGPVLVPLVAFVYQRTDGNALFMCSRGWWGCGLSTGSRTWTVRLVICTTTIAWDAGGWPSR